MCHQNNLVCWTPCPPNFVFLAHVAKCVFQQFHGPQNRRLRQQWPSMKTMNNDRLSGRENSNWNPKHSKNLQNNRTIRSPNRHFVTIFCHQFMTNWDHQVGSWQCHGSQRSTCRQPWKNWCRIVAIYLLIVFFAWWLLKHVKIRSKHAWNPTLKINYVKLGLLFISKTA